ncbi:MAG: TonB-dependent receptor [Acidobacteria bacterium]|nr:TonB-dependent receptor [Acidobacteriota bacterium]
MISIPARHFPHLIAFILLFPLAGAAQSEASGQLAGRVTDQQDSVIPRAAVSAKNVQTQSEFRAVANEIGVYSIPSVPSGSYTISVTARGFRTTVLKDIRVDAGSTATADATMQVGLEDTVIYTVSRYEEEIINAPAAATVILEQTIQAAPTQNLADLLRAVPGVNVAQTSASSFGVNGRAAGAALPDAQLALIDGRTIYQDSFSYVAWNIVPTNLDDVKQVEVIRGPASAVWGANAMNGVVNIVTKPPREALGTTVALGIGTFDRSGGVAESNTGSLYYLNAAHVQALNDRWAFKLTGGVYAQDAFARPEGNIPNQYNLYPNPQYTNKGTTQPKADARVDYDFPDAYQHLTFAGGYAWSTGIWHGGFGGIRADMSGSYGKVDYVRGALRLSGYANNFTTDGTFLIRFEPSGRPLAWSDHNHAYHFEFSDLRKAGTRHLFSYGGSLRFTAYDLLNAPEAGRRTEVGAYLQDEILLSEHFRWIVGTRLDKIGNLDGVVFSPRTTFIIKPTPGQTFRVSYNRAYVAPSMIANYWKLDVMSWFNLGVLIHPILTGYSYPMRLEGSKNLKAPSLNAYELGYAATMANGRVHLGAAFYLNEMKNHISFPQAGSYTTQNPPPAWPLPAEVLDLLIAVNAFGPGNGLPSLYVGLSRGEGSRTRDKGIELSVAARLNRTIDGFANYSWQAKPEAKGFSVSELNMPPANRFNAGLNFDYKRYFGNVSVSYVGRAYWQDIILYGGWTDAYTVVNLGAGVRVDRYDKYTAMLKISNLANTMVQNHIYGDILKRQISGELRMRF